MRQRERNGVRIGQPVRDLDGKPLGRVDTLYEWGFLVVKGLPILFRQEQVIPYDEVRGERDGALVVSRSDRSLLELAAGELPRTWRIPVPPGFPAAATPSEARGVFSEEVLGDAVSGFTEGAAASTAPARPAPSPVTEEEVRVYQGSRGQASVPPPPEG
jgi:hypothetical protein